MRSTFLSVYTLAIGALAAPVTDQNPPGGQVTVGGGANANAGGPLGGVLGGGGSGGALGGILGGSGGSGGALSGILGGSGGSGGIGGLGGVLGGGSGGSGGILDKLLGGATGGAGGSATGLPGTATGGDINILPPLVPAIGNDPQKRPLGYPAADGPFLPGLNFAWFNEFVGGLLKSGQAPHKLDINGFLDNLADGLRKIESNNVIINGTLNQVVNGKLNKDQGMAGIEKPYQDTIIMLFEQIKKIFTATGVDISSRDLDRLRTLLFTLAGQVLFTAKLALTTLGARPELTRILHSALGLANNLMINANSLTGATGPPVYGAVSPILISAGYSIAKPALAIVADAVAGLPH